MVGLDELRRKPLLFHSLLDVWEALCEEKGLNWRDAKGYVDFVTYLKNEGVQLRILPVCPAPPGSKVKLAEDASKLLGEKAQALVIRLDEKSLGKVRVFPRVVSN